MGEEFLSKENEGEGEEEEEEEAMGVGVEIEKEKERESVRLKSQQQQRREALKLKGRKIGERKERSSNKKSPSPPPPSQSQQQTEEKFSLKEVLSRGKEFLSEGKDMLVEIEKESSCVGPRTTEFPVYCAESPQSVASDVVKPDAGQSDGGQYEEFLNKCLEGLETSTPTTSDITSPSVSVSGSAIMSPCNVTSPGMDFPGVNFPSRSGQYHQNVQKPELEFVRHLGDCGSGIRSEATHTQMPGYGQEAGGKYQYQSPSSFASSSTTAAFMAPSLEFSRKPLYPHHQRPQQLGWGRRVGSLESGQVAAAAAFGASAMNERLMEKLDAAAAGDTEASAEDNQKPSIDLSQLEYSVV
jgi:hypothetical protein